MPIAKLKDQINRLKSPSVEPEPTPPPDERDEVIERLEQSLAEERDKVAAFQGTIDELRFQNDTLETSYSKQLQDARECSEAAENALAELQARLDEVGGGEDLLGVLEAARSDLTQLTAERDRLRTRLRNAVDGRHSISADEGDEKETDPGAEIDAYSIDELLEDAVWAQEQSRLDKEKGRVPVSPTTDETQKDLVPPDLVFPATAEE